MEYLRLAMSTLPASSAPRRVYFVSFLEGSSSVTGGGSEVGGGGRSRVRGRSHGRRRELRLGIA
jgi:hypothetical protein